MKNYQYQIVRYVHDHFTGEFVNVGIVLYSKNEKFLAFQYSNNLTRVSHLFPGVNTPWLKRTLHGIQQQIELVAKQWNELFEPADLLEQITQSIYPPDDSALQFGKPLMGIDPNLEAALQHLFCTYVTQYSAPKTDASAIPDDDIWKKWYKNYFEQYGIASRLHTHQVNIPQDVLTFDRAWKNDVWHCFEPISFCMKDKEAIRDKVYKWAGKLKGLQQTKENIHLVLLSSIATDHETKKPFIQEYLNITSDHLQVELITEDQAEALARDISSKMQAHDKH
jgi:hypothetical protein